MLYLKINEKMSTTKTTKKEKRNKDESELA